MKKATADNVTSASAPPKFMLRRDVISATGLATSTIYELAARGDFPKPVLRLTPRRVGWLASEIEEWQYARIAERNEAEAVSR